MNAFFTTLDGHWFTPTEHCRGPWDADVCHAGPPSGLLARASERLVPEQQLVRLTVDLTCPIPHVGFGVVATVTRAGRTVSTTEMAIVDADGKPIVSGRGIHVAGGHPGPLPTVEYPVPALAEARADRFPISVGAHGLAMFSGGIEVRYPTGDEAGPGPTRMWMRTVPLLADEPGSGFQRICPLADCGNAISRNAEADDFVFVNTDLTIALHRQPVGEWFGSDSVSRREPTGLGISDSLLFDEHGAVGRAVQALLIRPRWHAAAPGAPAGEHRAPS